MAEPTLSELVNIKGDPLAGGGEVTPVIDNSKIVDTLNDAAKFHAENTWRKYTQFLKNKKELFEKIGDIQGLETAQQDREYLKDQAANIFRDIMKDPSAIVGGRGYDELQGKMAKFKSDAMTSKQDKLDYDANQKFLAANPELSTEENTAAMENFFAPQLGQRKSVLLKMPTLFDEKTAVEGGIKDATTKTEELVGRDGKPGKGYIASVSTFDPEKFKTSWGMIAKGGQIDKNAHDLKKAVEERYSHLPPDVKEKYDKAGGIEAYWADKGEQYVKAYFKDGPYRVVTDIKPDTGYLVDEKFGLEKDKFKQDKKEGNARIAQEWDRIGIAKAQLKKSNTEINDSALSVLNEASSIINNGTPQKIVDDKGNSKEVLRISDPTLLQAFGNIDRDGNAANVPDAMNYDKETNQVTLLYYSKQDKALMTGEDKDKPIKKAGFRYEREIPLDQRTWLKVITKRSYPNKDIGEINNLIEEALKQNGNSLFEISKKVKGPATTTPAPATTTKRKLPIFAPKK